MNNETWQTIAPTETGIWLHRCNETDNEISPVIITNSEHGLVANCKDIGKTLLCDYHNGLTKSEWRKPSSV